MALGLSIQGFRPIMVQQRSDFSFTSAEQIINQIAKTEYMSNDRFNVPIVIRMIVGRGWGQGPQHSQSLQALFSMVPGLKVVMPTTAHDAKGMMVAAIKDNNPVIFIEHRWLHPIVDLVPESIYEVPLDRAKILCEGSDVTVAAFSYMTFEALITARALLTIMGISVELIDMRSVRPLDSQTVIDSVKKTGRLIVADTAYKTGSIAAELISQVLEGAFESLKAAPIRVCSPDFPTPTAPSMTEGYYPTSGTIADAALKLLGKDDPINSNQLQDLKQLLTLNGMHDIPNREFKGPF
jgi:pyruvate dehydrogenase E1 component beta subunit